ncbi:hypothetical protein, partial [Metabacillus fastidiosus]|uniref:hypothetical protein n=1 Tax=Metabacillus fastidiosus TaxID=1458 RepID=UPI002E208ADB|nr:hypothetical protein [Metabacillus fastidiosus]
MSLTLTAVLEARDRMSDTLRRINSNVDGTRRILRDLNRSGINAFTGMSAKAGTTVSAISALIPASAS